MGFPAVYLDKINLDDCNNFDLIIIILFISDFWLGVVILKNAKHLKKI